MKRPSDDVANAKERADGADLPPWPCAQNKELIAEDAQQSHDAEKLMDRRQATSLTARFDVGMSQSVLDHSFFSIHSTIASASFSACKLRAWIGHFPTIRVLLLYSFGNSCRFTLIRSLIGKHRHCALCW